MQRAPWRRARAARGESRPGEGGPGLTLAISFLTLAVAYGLSFTFPVFYVALLTEFGQGRGPTAAVYSLHMLVGGGISPLIGYCMDRSGPRLLLPTGATRLVLDGKRRGARLQQEEKPGFSVLCRRPLHERVRAKMTRL